MSDKIECPKCHHAFVPTEEATKKIRAEFEEKLESAEKQMQSDIRAQVEKKLKEFRSEGYNLAKSEFSTKSAAIEEELQEVRDRLASTQASELALRKASREVEESKRTLELTLTRKLDEERDRIRTETGARMEEEFSLKRAEWTKKHEDMEKLITELRQKAEQGSQQTQGEVMELEVETILREAFKHDEIEPVAKGVKGGDIVQRVRNGQGPVGAILWELKRTKHWSDSWLTKLKDDKREAKAELAVIITAALPEGIKHMGLVDGVWVTDFQSFAGLAVALRSGLLEVARARGAAVGKNEKMESLYSYCSGSEFRGRVDAIVEAFTAMKEDLDAEKRAVEKAWAKREKQITRVIGNTAGMYGELQGIIGASLPEIPTLVMAD